MKYEAQVADSAREPVVVEYAKSFFPVLLVVFVLRSFLVEPFQIPSSSMVPTLEVGDYILVNKYTYGIRLPVVRTKVLSLNEPKRGDVMVFFPPHLNDTYYIKRVVGLPDVSVSPADVGVGEGVLLAGGLSDRDEGIGHRARVVERAGEGGHASALR